MTVVVTACSAIGIAVSGAETEIMCQQTEDGGKVAFTVDASV